MNDSKCNHEACHCKGAELQGDGYCSEACREKKMNGDGRCACGHPDCR